MWKILSARFWLSFFFAAKYRIDKFPEEKRQKGNSTKEFTNYQRFAEGIGLRVRFYLGKSFFNENAIYSFKFQRNPILLLCNYVILNYDKTEMFLPSALAVKRRNFSPSVFGIVLHKGSGLLKGQISMYSLIIAFLVFELLKKFRSAGNFDLFLKFWGNWLVPIFRLALEVRAAKQCKKMKSGKKEKNNSEKI